jgi:hypothetical protein
MDRRVRLVSRGSARFRSGNRPHPWGGGGSRALGSNCVRELSLHRKEPNHYWAAIVAADPVEWARLFRRRIAGVVGDVGADGTERRAPSVAAS